MCFFGLCFQLTLEGPIEVIKKISVFEVISVVGFTIAIVSLFVAVKSSLRQTKTRQAEFSFRVWEAFIQDDVQQAYLEIEWDEFNYPYHTKTAFKNPEQERRIDKLLYLLDEMALLYERKILTKSDKERWSYHGERVFRDQGIIRYLEFLDGFYKDNRIDGVPHEQSRRVFSSSKTVQTV